MPIFHKVKQGTSEWLAIRAGLPTASAMDQIITPGGKISKSSERYLLTLLAERLLGRPIVEHVSYWMNRGSELEKEALAFYSFQTDQETEEIGFVTTDDGKIGASPDRLVGSEGLLEVKCPAPWVHMGYLLEDGSAYEAYRIQCQAQLFVTERQFVDVLSYNPELPPSLNRVERDEEFIAILRSAVTAFVMQLEAAWELCQSRGWVQTPPVREKSPSDLMREALLEAQKR